MGYYLTTDPENAVPPKSRATPKTHVPGSPVKVRGHRYYSTEMGRWMSRDPAEEDGGLYLYIGNSPCVSIDYLGLFSVTDVSVVMYAKGWMKGVAMQDKWFGGYFDSATWTGDARTGHPWPNPDLTTITMSWSLGFDRVRDSYDKIFSDKLYAKDIVKPYIKSMAAKYLGVTGTGAFGGFSKAFADLHLEHIQHRDISNGYLGGPLDDFKAALGEATLYVLVKGQKTSRICYMLEEVGVYIYDRFEFNDKKGAWFSQPLGYWQLSPPSVVRIPLPGYTKITNKTYRDWRTAHQKGMDFEMFSDVKSVSLTPPVVLLIP